MISISFTDRVLFAVSKIKRGQTRSYAQIAEEAGSPHAARVVGSIMKANKNPAVPCHRVIRADGSCGEYNRGRAQKYHLLQAEGCKNVRK